MKKPSGIRSFFGNKIWIRIWKYTFAALVFVVASSGYAQDGSEQRGEVATIRGFVLDVSGKAVGGVVVRLKQKDGRQVQDVTTNADGGFDFPNLRAGSYRIDAEKVGAGSDVLEVDLVSGAERQIRVVLKSAGATGANATLASPAEGMEFSDKPNFTVAGITDWTAVGGHGSDASLRTSESLARETAALKPETLTGDVAYLSGSNGASEEQLRAALRSDPRSFEANYRLGEFYCHRGRYSESIPLLETAYKIDPENRRNEYVLVIAYKGAGDIPHAHEQLVKLMAHEDNADLHRIAGDLDEEMGDSLATVREYERAVQLDPSEQNYFAWGSELLLHRAVWPAGEVFRKGAEAYPKSARMQAALGAALFAAAHYDEAAQRVCDASELNRNDVSPYLLLGEIDMAAPTPVVCAEFKLARFVQQHPDNARSYFYYAMAIWKRQQRTENAQKMEKVKGLLTKAVTIDHKYGEAYLQLGNIYSDKRSYENAVACYRKAIEAEPQLSEAHYRLGVAYERTGAIAKAKEEFQRHDEIEKTQAADVEHQRQEVKQFMIVLKGQPAPAQQ